MRFNVENNELILVEIERREGGEEEANGRYKRKVSLSLMGMGE